MAESRSKEKSPLAQQRARRLRILLIVVGSVFTMLLVFLLTSFLYKSGRGEKWEPFAFLFGKTQEATLPPLPTMPSELISSLIGETDTTGETPSASESAVSETSESAAPETTPSESESDETTSQEETTAETETSPVESQSREESGDDPQDVHDLKTHLQLAGLEESALIGSQLVVVRGEGESRCTLYFFEKEEDKWVLSSAVPAANGVLGKDGIRLLKEPGDKVTPAGYFALGPAYGMSSSAVTSMEYHQFQSGDVWVTDPASAYYNRLANTHQEDMDWVGSLSFLSQLDAYKYAVLINFNPGGASNTSGTSVFLNVQTGDETAGDIAVREATLFSLLQWLSSEEDPHILIYQYETHNP